MQRLRDMLRLKRTDRRRSQRIPWYASRGPLGTTILAVIGLCLVFVGLRAWLGPASAPQPSPGTFVVRIAPFVVEGGDQRTGETVADQLVQALPRRLTASMNLGRLREPVTTTAEATAAAERNGAQVIIWGSVAEGATADAAALRPRLTWLPPAGWTPNSWIDGTQWAWPQHFELARAPLNGTVVLPPLLDGLAQLDDGAIDNALPKLSTLRQDYADVLSAELPASLEAFMLWAQGLDDAAAAAARVAIEAAPRGATWNNLGVVLYARGEWDAARDAWDQALALEPELTQANANRGRLALEQGRAEEALAPLETAARGGNPTALMLLTRALRHTGRFQQARVVVTQLLVQRPTDTEAVTERALLALTGVATTTGRLEWQLEDEPIRSAAEIADLRSQMATVVDQTEQARTAALQQAAAYGAAGKPALQRLAEMQARRLAARQAQQSYVLLLIQIEQGRIFAADPPNVFSRFWRWVRGVRTPLQAAAADAATVRAATDDPQLRYDLQYQEGRARYLAGDRAGAQAAWTAATTLTDTAVLAPQPEAVYAQGRLSLEEGQPQAARPLFEQAVAIAPNYGPARRQLLALARTEQRWGDVETQLRWLLDREGSPSALIELADVLRRQDRLAEAEAVLLPLANANNPDALVALGALYRAVGQLDGAARVLARAVSGAAPSAAAYEELAAVELARPEPDLQAAENNLRQAIVAQPGRVSAHVALAQLLVRRGQPTEAAQQFQAAVAINSNDPQVYRELGQVLLDSGQGPAAADSFRRAIRLQPNDHEAHHGLAMAYLQLNRLDEARAEENTTLQLANGNYTLALVGLGDIEQAAGNQSVAIEQYQAALAQDPRVAAAFLGLGKVAQAQGALDGALKHYQDGLLANPDDVPLLMYLGKAQLERGDAAAAEQAFGRVLQLRSGDAAAFAGLGQALWQQGRSAEARNQFTEAVRRNPNDAEAWLALGEINATNEQTAAALESYAQAAEARPDWYEPQYRRGVLLLENNQAGAAVEALQAAVRLNDDFPQGHYWLGRSYRAIANLADAERQLQQAVSLDPNYYEARFFLGRVLDERGQGDKALAIYQALVAEAPEGNQWRNEAAQELARLGGS